MTDDFAILDLLDALVRKSLLVADRSVGADPVFDAGDDPPVRRGATRRPRRGDPRSGPPMPATSPDAKPTSWPCGTAPANVRPTTGSPSNWPICAPRFGGPPTRRSGCRRHHRHLCGVARRYWSKHYEPIAWAEELIEPARAVDHPRLAFLYVMASLCSRRTDRGGCRLQRRRARSLSAGPRCAAVRHRRPGLELCT